MLVVVNILVLECKCSKSSFTKCPVELPFCAHPFSHAILVGVDRFSTSACHYESEVFEKTHVVSVKYRLDAIIHQIQAHIASVNEYTLLFMAPHKSVYPRNLT